MNQIYRFNPTKERLRENYLAVLDRIQAAASRSARLSSDIQLIGVTKYVDNSVARWLAELGCNQLAESRPQALWEKAAALANLPVKWHLIGHLQRNKAKRTLEIVSTMHSLDSARILEQIQQDTLKREIPLQLLLEINISGTPEKTGMLAAEAAVLLEHWVNKSHEFSNLAVVGLMGMGTLDGGPSRTRRDFESLRELRDDWAGRFGIPLRELSMGMSDDFEIAIEEGATMVRLGSTLFADN